MNLFNSKSNSKEEFDNVIKAARQERFKEKENHRNATKIQVGLIFLKMVNSK